jgi:hypothetical protein
MFACEKRTSRRLSFTGVVPKALTEREFALRGGQLPDYYTMSEAILGIVPGALPVPVSEVILDVMHGSFAGADTDGALAEPGPYEAFIESEPDEAVTESELDEAVAEPEPDEAVAEPEPDEAVAEPETKVFTRARARRRKAIVMIDLRSPEDDHKRKRGVIIDLTESEDE